MRKFILTTLMLFMGIVMVVAAGTAEIKFENTTHDFGSFSESSPKVTCTFKFTNVGDSPLAIQPGESGEIIVTYNGAGKFPGRFQKTITLRTNGKSEITRLIVKGDMMPAAADAE